MTYKEDAQKLAGVVAEKLEVMSAIWHHLSKSYPASEINAHIKDKEEYKHWQQAQKEELGFLSYMKNHDINPDDLLPDSLTTNIQKDT